MGESRKSIDPRKAGMEPGVAKKNTILRGVVGSQLYGTNLETSDRDEMGILIEPKEYIFGLESFEQHIERDREVGEKSQPGDTDVVIYGLQKFCRLALNGNPSVIVLLYAPISTLMVYTPVAARLRERRKAFISHLTITAFEKYLNDQRRRLLNTHGMKVNRPDLVEKFGYDTKYASQMLRLAYQGVDLVKTGGLHFPLPDFQRNRILDVRMGRVSKDEVLREAFELEMGIAGLKERANLPSHPDITTITEFLVREYPRFWGEQEARAVIDSLYRLHPGAVRPVGE